MRQRTTHHDDSRHSRHKHGGFGHDGPRSRGGHGPRGRRRGGPGRRRGRRGDIRAAILLLLAEQPRHGYEIIGEISERSGGLWRPSPGSIYPTLQLLADEGLVSSDEQSGKRLFELTDSGSEAASKLDGNPPWDEFTHDSDPVELELRAAAAALTSAMRQVSTAGSSVQQAKAVTVLNEARSSLYGILGEIDDAG